MKRILGALFFCLIASAAIAQRSEKADPQADAKEFTDGLSAAMAPCRSMQELQATEEKLADMSANSSFDRGGPGRDFSAVNAKNQADREKLNACQLTAKDQAKQLYSAFVAKTQSAQLKTDAKAVFAAWLDCLSAPVSDGNSVAPAWQELSHAKSVLQVDSIAP